MHCAEQSLTEHLSKKDLLQARLRRDVQFPHELEKAYSGGRKLLRDTLGQTRAV